tara:strand:- start:298 stop:1002 length:705 start_codon:yes stop_codon:yes gene_type:complete
MIKGKTAKKIRKAHRYLGLFLGIQFLFWTISGLFFSWTNINEIRGEHLINKNVKLIDFSELISPSKLIESNINSIELRNISGIPYYWINNANLYNAYSGNLKHSITKNEAVDIAKQNLVKGLEIESINYITTVNKHHEYRNKLLPAYVISFKDNKNIKSYISSLDGKFQNVRHRNWRWFDFLWMTHTMDYESRDNFNNTLLRAFSLLGLITVLSGFTLWFTSSPTIRKIFYKKT